MLLANGSAPKNKLFEKEKDNKKNQQCVWAKYSLFTFYESQSIRERGHRYIALTR